MLLPGDPHRALAVAQALLDAPKMFNHTRGLWGYTGMAADGEPLTVQSTGMGGPSAAIVVEELIALGARTLVRIGTCGALVDDLELGDLVAARRGARRPTARAARSAPTGALGSDPELLERLVAAGATAGDGASPRDLFYDPREAPPTAGASAARCGRRDGGGDAPPGGGAPRRARPAACSRSPTCPRPAVRSGRTPSSSRSSGSRLGEPATRPSEALAAHRPAERCALRR